MIENIFTKLNSYGGWKNFRCRISSTNYKVENITPMERGLAISLCSDDENKVRKTFFGSDFILLIEMGVIKVTSQPDKISTNRSKWVR